MDFSSKPRSGDTLADEKRMINDSWKFGGRLSGFWAQQDANSAWLSPAPRFVFSSNIQPTPRCLLRLHVIRRCGRFAALHTGYHIPPTLGRIPTMSHVAKKYAGPLI